MHFRAPFLSILLLATSCHTSDTDAANSTKINYTKNMEDPNSHAEALLAKDVENAAALNLPKGFNPQPPPMKPLLYPFVTASPTSIVISPGWKPFFQPASSSTQRNILHPPLVQTEPIAKVSEAQFLDGPPMESVVYGTWKPDRPLEPHKILETTESYTPSSERTRDTQESDSLESILTDKLDPPSFHRGSAELSNERRYNIDINKQNIDKSGRQKITISPSHRQTGGYSSSKNAPEVINVNISDPTLLAMAKHINDSIEHTTTSATADNATTKQSTWVPFVPTDRIDDSDQTTPTAKMWPKDFMTSNEHMAPLKDDSSESPQTLNGHDSAPTMLAEMPVNITKMGVPYEDQNSSDEATICVPLIVREKIVTNAETQIVDVERIYCFPLPATDMEMATSNAINATSATATSTESTLGVDAKVNNWSDYEETAATADGARLLPSKSSTIIALCSLLARLHVIMFKG